MADDWLPDIGAYGKPHYRAIAEAIAADIRDGRLRVSERLPPQRELATRLGINFTTVARGYVEAQKRGLIEARVGQGTFVAGQPRRSRASDRPAVADLTMNLAPEPENRALVDRMQAGMVKIARDLPTLMRYQAFGGTWVQRETVARNLGRRGLSAGPDRVLICPGTHLAFHAILRLLAAPGDTLLCEALTYPGIKAVAAQLGLNLVGLPLGAEGIDADALEAYCKAERPKLLYLNPTILNPTTATMPEAARWRVIEIARAHGLTIIEDDAYSGLMRQPPPAFAHLAPEITYFVATLSKCVGAGLRLAFLVAPDQKAVWALANILRTLSVMASPISTALATQWFEDGTALLVTQGIQKECAIRQALVREILRPGTYQTHPEGFHLWMVLPEPWQRAAFATRLHTSDIGVVVSDAFAVTQPPEEAVRISLGGVLSRAEVRAALEFIAYLIDNESEADGHFG